MSLAPLATSAIRQAADLLRAEVVTSRHDAKRCDARGFRIMAADIRERANRLEALAGTLADVLEERGQAA